MSCSRKQHSERPPPGEVQQVTPQIPATLLLLYASEHSTMACVDEMKYIVKPV